MASRELKDLHPELRKRWSKGLEIYTARFPDMPVPMVTCTYRSPDEQNRLYAKGRTTGGSKVTNAKGGQSLHNYSPALAFDVVFKGSDGKVTWTWSHYARLATILKALGLAWGGDWKSVKDGAHFEPPNYSWKKAQAGTPPAFAPMPATIP
jgi:peptidoglycan L-alanyl-D-glutamate endopeptidase CwlK